MNAFAAKKLQAVSSAERSLEKAEARLADALGQYGNAVAEHEQRGDGFFPKSYLIARKEAVLAQKYRDTCKARLRTAQAEAEAATLEGIEA